MSVEQRQRELLADLLLIENAQERLAAIVERPHPRLAADGSERTEDRRVPGCVSPVWLAAELRDGLCHFRSDAESPLVRGLVGLLCEIYSGATPADVLAVEPFLLTELGLDRSLSPTRLNGLRSVRACIRAFAARAAP